MKNIGDKFQGRTILSIEEFKAKGTFNAYYEAVAYLSKLNYETGSMARDMPIGFKKVDVCCFIGKWYNLSQKDKAQLDGVIISNDFREGDVQILFFNN